ncbi:MAG: CDP-alcohol phosphatidyltransferase family protein [Gemmatimonadota bacterium]|nr:MAG: CDP-alcohol phosphatidyltransferase family protein [Gemmatimonadota bacterium]
MPEAAMPGKVPNSARFLDISDYARPLAVALAHALKPSRVTAPWVTGAWFVIGLAAALCYAKGGAAYALVGALGMQAKNVLDAVDGSLARLQNRPSRIGRFLDSNADALIAAAVCAALGVAVGRHRPATYSAILAVMALLSGLLQASLYNYYYVRYRARRGGDTTSRVEESLTGEDRLRYGGRPAALALLSALIAGYRWIYGWQDALVQRVDDWAARPLASRGRLAEAEGMRDARVLLTAISVLGPGTQILALNLYTLFGLWRLSHALELYLLTVAVGGSLYAAAVVLCLRQAAARRARV